jgi:hypothetical protein
MSLRPLWWLMRLSKAGHGRAVGVLSVWIWWDRLLEWHWRLRPVQVDAFLRYRVARHRGPSVRRRDGTVINTGDLLIELHVDNAGLLERVGAAAWSPWHVFRLVDADLRGLNHLLEAGELPLVRALHGTTLYAAAGPRLGFEVRPVPHTWSWAWQRFYLIGPLAIYHPTAGARSSECAAIGGPPNSE